MTLYEFYSIEPNPTKHQKISIIRSKYQFRRKYLSFIVNRQYFEAKTNLGYKNEAIKMRL